MNADIKGKFLIRRIFESPLTRRAAVTARLKSGKMTYLPFFFLTRTTGIPCVTLLTLVSAWIRDM